MKQVPYKSLQRQPNLADQVVEQIKDLIAKQELRPGDKLPTERELTEYLGVSRTVIREATRTLNAQGLVEIRASSGMVIAKPDKGNVSEAFSLYLKLNAGDPLVELFEVRRLLEVEIAGIAAERATLANLEEMQRLLQYIDKNRAYPERVAKADVQFHSAIAEATQNHIFVLLLDSVVDLMLEVRQKSVMVPENVATAAIHHQRILDEITARNPEGARQAMLDHIIVGERLMRISLQEQASKQNSSKNR